MEYVLHRYQHGGVSKTCFLWRARLVCSESKGGRACSGPPERLRAGLRSCLARREPTFGLAIASTKICRSQGLGLRHAGGRATNCARPTGHGRACLAGARAGLVRKTPGSAEAREGLVSVRSGAQHELRMGQDNDLLSYSAGFRDEWISLASQWTSHWTTYVAGTFYQRSGVEAGKFVTSITRRQSKWGALTV